MDQDIERNLTSILKNKRQSFDDSKLMHFNSIKNQQSIETKIIMSKNADDNKGLRETVRDFLESKQKSVVFDQLDEFSDCMKYLHQNAKQFSLEMNRVIVKLGIEKQHIGDIETEFENKQTQKLRNFSLLDKPHHHHHQNNANTVSQQQQFKQQQLIDKMKVTSTVKKLFIIKKTPNLITNFGITNANKTKQNQNNNNLNSNQQQQLQDNSVIQPAQSINHDFQSQLIQKQQQNQQSQQVQLLDISQYSDKVEQEYIDFDKEALKKEENLQKMFQEFRNVSQKLKNYGEDFKETLDQLHSVKKLKSNDIFFKKQIQSKMSLGIGLTLEEEHLIKYEQGLKQEEMIKKQDKLSLNVTEYKLNLQKQFRKQIWLIVEKMKKLNLSIKDISYHKPFPDVPYERQNSEKFFFYVKDAEIEQVQKMLKICKFYVYEFDSTKQTPLHWAVRRNNLEMVNLLIEKGSDLEAQDMAGRTPIFMAVKNENVDMVRILLIRGATPRVKCISNKKPRDFTKNGVILQLLMVADYQQIFLHLVPEKKRREFWHKYSIPSLINSTNSDEINEIMNDKKHN